jgi:hypothetical protein
LLELVSSSLQQCEAELTQLKAKEPRRLPTQQRVLDVTLLLLTGAWFYRAWQLGGGQEGQGGLHGFGTGLLDSLPGFGAAGLLPVDYHGLEKALALMLLLAALSRVIMARVA